MKKIKRAISLMLVMSMVVSLFAMTGYTASAAERPNSVAYTNGSIVKYTVSTSDILTVTPPTTIYVNESNVIPDGINKNTFADTKADNETTYNPTAWEKTNLNTNVVLNFSQTVDSATLTAVAIDANGNEETLNNITVAGAAGSISENNLNGTVPVEVAGTATKNDGSPLETLTYRIDYTIGGKTYTRYAASYVSVLPTYKLTTLNIWNNTYSEQKKSHLIAYGIRMDFSDFLGEGFDVETNSIGISGIKTKTSGSGTSEKYTEILMSFQGSTSHNYSSSDRTKSLDATWLNGLVTPTNLSSDSLPTLYRTLPDNYYTAIYNSGDRTKDSWNEGYSLGEKSTFTQGATIYYDPAVASGKVTVPVPMDLIGMGDHCSKCDILKKVESGAFVLTKLDSYSDTESWGNPITWDTTTSTKPTGDDSISYSFYSDDSYYKASWTNGTEGQLKTQNSSITFNFGSTQFKGNDVSYRWGINTRSCTIERTGSHYGLSGRNWYRTGTIYGFHFNFKAATRANAHAVISADKTAYVKDEWTNWNDYRNQVVGAYSAIGNLKSGSDLGVNTLTVPSGFIEKATVSVDNLKALIGTTLAKCGECNATGKNYYTADSWNAYQTALSTANSVANSISGAYLTAEAETKQTEVNNAGATLANAINALEIGEAAHEPYHNDKPTVSSKANGTEANSALNAIITEKNLGGTAYASAAKASPAFVETTKGTETANSNVYLYTNDSVNTMYIVEASASLAKPVTISIRARSKHGTPYYYAAAGAKVAATAASTSTASDFVILNPTFKDNTSGPDSEMKRSFVEYQIIATGANGKQETYSVTFAYYNDDNNGTKLGVDYIDGNKWTSNGFGIRRIHDNAVRWWEFVGKDDARAYDKDFGSSAYGSFALKVSGYANAAAVTAAIKNGTLSTDGAIVYGGNKVNSNIPVHDDYYFKAENAKSGDQYYVHLVDRFGNTCSELITIEKTDSTEPTVQSNGSSATVSDKGGSMIESLELTSNGEAYNGWTLSEDNNAVGNNTLSLSNLAPNATYSLTATDAAGNASTASLTADDNGNAKITVNNFSDLRYLEKDNYKVNRKTGEDKSVATVLLNGEAVTINNNVTVSLWQRIIRALADFFNSLLGFKVA